MFFEVNDREPIYLQIIRHIKQSLVIGSLKPGDHIPSRRELAEMLKVNPNTVQRAYRDMETMGLIETIRNKPSTITEDEEILKNIRKELVEDALDGFIESFKERLEGIDFEEGTYDMSFKDYLEEELIGYSETEYEEFEEETYMDRLERQQIGEEEYIKTYGKNNFIDK